MIRLDHAVEVARPADHAFDVVARHYVENHPRWEDEVVEVRPVSDGPVCVGYESVMVRREMGRTTQVPTRCTAYDEGRAVAFAHAAGPMDFAIRFDFVPLGETRSRVDVSVEMRPHGLLRIASPALRARGRRIGDRITTRMGSVIEETQAPVIRATGGAEA